MLELANMNIKQNQFQEKNRWSVTKNHKIFSFTKKINYWAKICQFTEGQKIKKKLQGKKLVKTNKSNSRIDQVPFFAILKIVKNQFLNWEKV